MSYDDLNRLLESTWPGATGNELKTVTYIWDSPCIGSLGSVKERDAAGQFLYCRQPGKAGGLPRMSYNHRLAVLLNCPPFATAPP